MKRSNGLIGFLLVALAFCPKIAAQGDTLSVRISGRIRDPLQRPIAGAEVRVVGTTLSVVSSDSGFFRLIAPNTSPILVQIRRPGYRAQLLRINESWSGTILLEPGVYELPGIQVTARMAKPANYANTNKYDGFFRRQHIGFGEFVTREEIDRRSAQHTAQLLETRPGVRVDFRQGEIASGGQGTIVAFARCNEYPPKINVYVDGHKLQPRSVMDRGGDLAMQMMSGGVSPAEIQRRREVRGIVGEMLDRINPSDIELMEIYRGPSELPGEFHDGNCGAIVIWTREGAR